MRNIFSLMFVVMFAFAMPAFAEKIVPPGPATSKYDAAPQPPSASKPVAKSKAVKAVKTNLATKKDIKNLSGRIKSLEGQTKKLANETKSYVGSVNSLSGNVSKLADSVENDANATRNLSRRVTGVENRIDSEAKNLGDQAFGNTLVLGIGGFLLTLIIAGLVTWVILRAIRTRAANVNLQPLEDAVNSRSDEIINVVRAGLAAVQTGMGNIPQQTADLVKMLDPIRIELPDVVGHNVIYAPPIEDDMYVTFYVPSTVSQPTANPDAISRMRMTDKAAVRRSVRKTMADYFLRLAADPNPATEQDRQQKALIEHLIATGQLVVS